MSRRPTPPTAPPLARLPIASAALFLGLAACGTYGGAALLDVRAEVVAPSGGMVLKAPDAIETAEGTRFHGWICQARPVVSPTRIRVERLDASGALVASITRPVRGLGGRGPRCSLYDLPTAWRIAPDEHIRICALRSDAPCTPALGAAPNAVSRPPA